MERVNEFDEKLALREIQKEFKNISKYLEPFVNLKQEPDSLEKLTKALNSLPSGEIFSKVIEELKTKSNNILKEAQTIRSQSFKRIEAEYIRRVKENGKVVRESSNGWRVGPVELQLKPEMSQIRILYNREILLNWLPVSSAEDIFKAEEKALSILGKVTIPDGDLVLVCWEAFDQARKRQSTKTNANLVLLSDFYKEFRIALVRLFFERKSPTSKIDWASDVPKWAFLFNLDRFRALGSIVPTEKRIGLQTGSQQEVSQGKGMVLNGLDPLQDYKMMCYVFPAKGV